MKTLSLAPIRKQLHLANNHPIRIIGDDSPPKIIGEVWHYKTRGGTRINHSSAYSKKGRNNMVYCASTYGAEVGLLWLRDNEPQLFAAVVSTRLNNMVLGKSISFALSATTTGPTTAVPGRSICSLQVSAPPKKPTNDKTTGGVK